MKIVNVKGIIILLILFIAVQISFALIISPILGPIVIEAINTQAGTKISIAKVTIWPLTLSCSLKDLKVFDPDNEKERIALIPKASLKISPIALLSKRLVISRLSISGAEIDLKGEPDGSFNIQKLARPKEEDQAPKKGFFDRFQQKKDWFGRIYGMIKDSSSKEADEKRAAAKKRAKKVERKIVELPHGRRVQFVKPSDEYIFEIKDFSFKNAVLKLESATGETVDVDKASVYIKNLKLDPVQGAHFDKFGIKGVISKDGTPSGSFDVDYAQSSRRGRNAVVSDLSAKNIDLTAIKFIYQDSLPVNFEKGIVTLSSHTKIIDGAIDSGNTLILKDHTVVAKGGSQVVGFMPLETVCEALNQVDPFKMKFRITGTVEHPQFKGFEDALMSLLKPYIANVAKDLEKQGLKALDSYLQKETGSSGGSPSAESDAAGEAAAKAVESIKSLFGDQKK